MSARCPRCKEKSEHLYGNTYECKVCLVVYEWRPVRVGNKVSWVAYGKTEETVELSN